MKNQTKATIVLEGTYRASDANRAYRVVRLTDGKLVVETERTIDALGNVVWGDGNSFNTQCSVEGEVLKKLVEKANL